MKKRILFISFCVLIVGFIYYLRAGKQDIMQVYKVYQKDDLVIVENRKAPNLFKYEERIFYSNFIEGIYLCTKEKSIARNKKSAFLLVDLGEIGEWWADPFGNLQTDKTVLNEYIPNAFIDEIKEHIDLNWGNSLTQMMDKVEINELTEREIQRIAPEVYEVVYDEEAVSQWYQEVDFDNDNRMDIVVYNKLGMGRGGFKETYFYQQLSGGQYRKTHQINSTYSVTRFLQYDGNTYFMVSSVLDYNVPENAYDYSDCELYYFQDGYPVEVVQLTPQDSHINVTVRKRFINDFINISEGYR